MSFPTKEERAQCWSSRDEYWSCLDKNKSSEGDNICMEFRKMYEKNCTAQWVKHFDRKRNYLLFKEKIEKDGIPNKGKNDSSFNEPRRIYHQIVCS
ncbi:cytochrome c oxidase assembly factor 6 homolog isoform X2 [Leptinotarsa decemlineata]